MHRKPLTAPGAFEPKPQIRKIAFEEHFLVPQGLETDTYGKVSQKDIDKHAVENGLTAEWFKQIYDRMVDFDEARLESMDAAGIDLSILSFMTPGVQGVTDARKAHDMALAVNDALAEKIARHPDRYAGMATLAAHNPEASARELERCVKTLGFKGVMWNGFSQIDAEENLVYLDEDRCGPIWEAAQALDVPIYLHPRPPYEQLVFKGHRRLISANWGSTCETSTHAVRILAGGVFDDFPLAKLILGHLGEALPFMAWRMQHWQEYNPDRPKRRVEDYLAENVWVTTAGNFSTPAFNCAMQVLGSDRILFSTDYPFENMEDAASWFESCPMAEVDRTKIAYANAKKLFKLPSSKA